MLNAGGFRVSPVEIESVLTRHSAVRDAAVVGAKKKNGATEIIAVVILAPKSKKSAALKNDILSYCARYLAPYKLPKRVAFATRLPRTSNGKLKRVAVAKR
jgi:acyl-coenzyme A synthetase/AMP-(fatty) acid ligase